MGQLSPWSFLLRQGLEEKECRCWLPLFAKALERAIKEIEGTELASKECLQEGFVAPYPLLQLAFDRLGLGVQTVDS